MDINEIKKIAKERGMTKKELILTYCPSEFGHLDGCDEIDGCKSAPSGLCYQCWKQSQKPEPDPEESLLTMESFNDDNDYESYMKSKEKSEMSKEQVNHPDHYSQPGRRECIEEMRIVFGDDAVRQWCVMTAYKYRYRTGNKDGNSSEQDNKKAEWYLDYAEEMD